MVKLLDYDIIVSEFEFQSCYYVHFQTKTFKESYEHHYPSSYSSKTWEGYEPLYPSSYSSSSWGRL